MEKFSKRLYEARIKLGYTQAEVAGLINVTQSSYSRMEHGLQEPNLKQLKKIGEVLNVSLDYLLDLDTDFYNNQVNKEVKEQVKLIYEKYISQEKTIESKKD